MTDFPRLSGTVSLDLETRDPLLKSHGPGWCFPDSGHIAGYAFSWAGGREKAYYPVGHEGEGNLNPKAVKRWVRDTLAQTGLTVVVHNYGYDLGWLRREGIPVRARVVDTLTAAPLLDEYRHSYGLDALGLDYLGKGKNEDALMAYGRGLRVVNPKTGRLIAAYRTVGAIKMTSWPRAANALHTCATWLPWAFSVGKRVWVT